MDDGWPLLDASGPAERTGGMVLLLRMRAAIVGFRERKRTVLRRGHGWKGWIKGKQEWVVPCQLEGNRGRKRKSLVTWVPRDWAY